MAFLATLATWLFAPKPDDLLPFEFEGNEKQDGGTKITTGTGSEQDGGETFEAQADKGEGSKHTRHRFILDSGSSIHATGNLWLLSEFTLIEPQGSDVPVFSASNGSALPIAGVGSIGFGNFHISSVHYVPGLRSESTRVSVSQLAERDYLVMFGGGCCYVKDRAGGGLLGSGRMHRHDGCYHLDFLDIPPAALQEQS